MEKFDTALFPQVRDYVMLNREKGVKCPCCDQFVKIYKRRINSSMCYALILIDQHFSNVEQPGPVTHWLHVPTFLASRSLSSSTLASIRGDWAKLRYWDLLVEKPGVRGDGSSRVGYWKITEKGRDFVRLRVEVRTYAHIYDDELIGFDGPMIDIEKALGKGFNYRELMER